MTRKNDKIRGLFLAALMVLSNTVGSIASTGMAAVQDLRTDAGATNPTEVKI